MPSLDRLDLNEDSNGDRKFYNFLLRLAKNTTILVIFVLETISLRETSHLHKWRLIFRQLLPCLLFQPADVLLFSPLSLFSYNVRNCTTKLQFVGQYVMFLTSFWLCEELTGISLACVLMWKKLMLIFVFFCISLLEQLMIFLSFLDLVPVSFWFDFCVEILSGAWFSK